MINLVNPGLCYGSELHRTVSVPLGKVFGGVKRVIGRPTEVGARTLGRGGFVAGKESYGRYMSAGKLASFMDFPLTAEGQAYGRQIWKMIAEELGTSVNVNGVIKEG